MDDIQFCFKCGNRISYNSQFCTKCGANLRIGIIAGDTQVIGEDLEGNEETDTSKFKNSNFQVGLVFIVMILVFAGFLFMYKGANEGIDSSQLDTNQSSSLLSRLNAAGDIKWEIDTFRNLSGWDGFETDYLTSDLSSSEGCNISVFDTLANAKKVSNFDLDSFMHSRWYGLDELSNKGAVLFSHAPNDACVEVAKSVLGWH